MPIDKHASREWRAQIRNVLNRDWDPIGGCPEDEYDNYVGAIAAKIRAGASDAELLQYLNWAEAEYIGLGTFDSDRAHKVVQTLRTLGPPP
ncbi:hypothetical protein MXD81_63635 [Microbacteriaceae bacterium K1510]|nr:hypothetical protein [Microbacteriaceae bacterium K1510]